MYVFVSRIEGNFRRFLQDGRTELAYFVEYRIPRLLMKVSCGCRMLCSNAHFSTISLISIAFYYLKVRPRQGTLLRPLFAPTTVILAENIVDYR